MLFKVTLEGWMCTDEPIRLSDFAHFNNDDFRRMMGHKNLVCEPVEITWVEEGNAPTEVLEYFDIDLNAQPKPKKEWRPWVRFFLRGKK